MKYNKLYKLILRIWNRLLPKYTTHLLKLYIERNKLSMKKLMKLSGTIITRSLKSFLKIRNKSNILIWQVFSKDFSPQLLQKENHRVNTYNINPKAISRGSLLGLIDPTTREWTDGVLTKIARTAVTDTGIVDTITYYRSPGIEWKLRKQDARQTRAIRTVH